MRMIHCSRFLAGIFCLVFWVSPLFAQSAEESHSGGLSRVRLDNVVVEVEGGIVRSLSGQDLLLWLLDLRACIRIYPWEGARGELSRRTLCFRVGNLDPSRVRVEGVKEWRKEGGEIVFTLETGPGRRKEVALVTEWEKPEFEFVVMGDSRDNPALFGRLLREVNKRRPLFTVNSGDFVSEGKPHEYAAFLQIIPLLQSPLFLTPGNHDVRRWGRRLYQQFFGPEYYSFTFADCAFIFLDNALLRFYDRQYRWLAAELEKNKGRRCFIFMHVPPFDPRERKHYAMDLPLNTQWFFDLMERYKVEAVFASHIHSYLEGRKGDTKYFISGGAGAPLRGEKTFYHYMAVTVGPDKEFAAEVVKVK